MKSLICWIFILLLSPLFFSGDRLPINSPKFLELNLSDKQVAIAEEIFFFNNPDTLIDHQMYILKDEDNLPLLYYADIQTPVCIDGICKPLFIELYWDLIGDYIGYGVYPDELLSKYDHEVFEDENYEKLHALLGDSYSIIGRRHLRGLYDIQQERAEKIKFKGKEIDGVTGATKKEVKNTIVEGALYSCYTLWHIAYGDAMRKIKDQLPNLYNEDVEDYFLDSDYENYNIYAAKHLPVSRFGSNLKPLIKIIKSANPLSRSYILKKMPKELFGRSELTEELFPHFSQLDFNSKTLLLQSLQHAQPENLAILAGQLSGLSKNQLKMYFDQLKQHPDVLDAALIDKLKQEANEDQFHNAYLVQSFVDELN